MAFRTGSVTGKGVVYSRRRGRGVSSNNSAFRNKASIIYEDTEEESDDRMKTLPCGEHKKPDASKTIGSLSHEF